jgi:hypothetical protein
LTTPKPGEQFASVMCDTRVVVVKSGDAAGRLTCGGAPMVPAHEAPAEVGDIRSGHEGPTVIGKRYVDAAGTIEVLCTKAGAGGLALDGEPLEAKAAKPLPSSD